MCRSSVFILKLSLVYVGTALGLASCSATYHEKIALAQESYQRGDFELADELIAKNLVETDESESEHDFFLMEKSVLDLVSGRYQDAEETLRGVRDTLDARDSEEMAALMGDFASYFTDDRSTTFTGEDYEKVMLRVFLAISNLMRQGDEVIAYANQVMEKQRQIRDEEFTLPDGTVEKFKTEYKYVGIGDYLYGLVTELDPTGSSEAAISYTRVQQHEPQFTAIETDLARVAGDVRPEAGHGAIYVLAMVGQGPEKVEVTEDNLAAATEIALQFTRFIDVIGEHFGPTLDLSPLRVPEVRARVQSIDSVEVSVNSSVVGMTETVTDVTAMAVSQWETNKRLVLAKAIARRMGKKAITTAAKAGAKIAAEKSGAPWWSGLLVELGGIVVNSAWSASERADTRHWTFLPASIQVLRIEQPAGPCEVELTPYFSGSQSGNSRTVAVEVIAGENAYVLGFLPTGTTSAAPTTSSPAAAATAVIP